MRTFISQLKRNTHKIKRIIKSWFKAFEKLVAFLIILGFVLSTASLVNAESIDAPVDTTKVTFDKNQFELVGYKTDQITIALGESRYNEEQRRLAEEAVRQAKSREVISRTAKGRVESFVEPDLVTKRALAKRAAESAGIAEHWKIVEAVWQVESGKRWQTYVRSYAGAQGPMQFMPGTWRRNQVDGNGDGVVDINHAEDAVYAGARLLANAGLKDGNVDRALLAYNRAGWYVKKVKKVADSIVE
jgi:hypothetical protein